MIYLYSVYVLKSIQITTIKFIIKYKLQKKFIIKFDLYIKWLGIQFDLR